jgi:hypothetical protein
MERRTTNRTIWVLGALLAGGGGDQGRRELAERLLAGAQGRRPAKKVTPAIWWGEGTASRRLREFYSRHFIPKMPPDTEIVPISRTIGSDRLVDEMIFRFTHTIEMDWMLPGIPPTGRRVEVPLVVIVHFRQGKLAHEHIYWDQASVLVQLGLIDVETLPVIGAETARKVLDPSLPANALMSRIGRGG